MQQSQHNHYIDRVNRVIDHISMHYDEEIPLKTLASVAGFSDFHFHRIFKSIIGETVSQFVWRVRVERGATLLRSNPDMTLLDVAIAVGFSSLAGFSRAFKARFGITPSKWNRQDQLQGETFRSGDDSFPVYRVEQLAQYEDKFEVQFRPMLAQRLAYIRVQDAYNNPNRIEAAYFQLLDWYQERGGRLTDTTLYGMSQDDPDITPLEQCRFDWCLHVPNDWIGDDVVSMRDFPTCQLAFISIDGDSVQMEDRILQYFWRYWLPRSQFQPVNLPGMEIYRRFPHEAGWWDTLFMDCAVPITRL